MWSQHFKRSKVLLPVIHVQSLEQTLRNVAIARDAGCDGVFLINHETTDGKRPFSYRDLLEVATAVYEQYPEWWLGINCLDLQTSDTFQHLPSFINGLWTDNAEIDETQREQPIAKKIQFERDRTGWQGFYFGGVSFKYQRPVKDDDTAAKIATHFMDVVTTSGSATGTAATTEKIKTMKEAIAPHPLAIASGITPDNVQRFLPYVDAFLVATGISKSFYELDAEKTAVLCQMIHDAAN